MSAEQQNNIPEEIDLGILFKKISGFFSNLSFSIFKGILFFKKNFVTIAILVVIGFIIGFYLDYKKNNYDNEIIVSANFGSVDYLYTKVKLINAKILQEDTLFLKSIGIKNPKKVIGIKIYPIIDIYNFVNTVPVNVNNVQNSQNFELVKLLADDGDINKVIKDSLTSRNYGQHKITIFTNGFTTNEKTINPILIYLNKSGYFKEYQKTFIDNIVTKNKENQIIINQIDNLLNQFANTTNNQKNDKLVYYNENNQLNEILNNKSALINEIGSNKIILKSLDKVIKDKSRVLNIKSKISVFNKMKFIIPLLLISGFISFILFINYYKKQNKKILLK